MAKEKRLIDVKPLMQSGWHLVKTGKNNKFLASMSLADAPTVDAVEVVRCKACDQHAETKVENVVYCKKFNRFMNADGFCFYGERREGE